MTLKEYQIEAYKTALPQVRDNINYMGLGLASEAGEVAGKLKKMIRKDDVPLKDLAHEVGDVLWYCAGLATVWNLDLEYIAKENLKKLKNRQIEGKLQGNGDTR